MNFRRLVVSKSYTTVFVAIDTEAPKLSVWIVPILLQYLSLYLFYAKNDKLIFNCTIL